jgi:hypothetical protein
MIRTPFYLSITGITLLEPPVWIGDIKPATNYMADDYQDNCWELQIGTRAGIITVYWPSAKFLGSLRANLMGELGTNPAITDES